MVDEQIFELFQGVLNKTRAGKIPWQPTAEESTFMAAIGGRFVLSISALASTFESGGQKYALVLEDKAGGELARITEADEGIRTDDFRELYGIARRRAVRNDEKIGDVLEVLSRL